MDRQIHIQHVLLSLEPGGLENGVVNIVNGLDPRRFRSSVCCLRRAGAFAARIRVPGAAIHDMGSSGGIDFLLPIRLARLFRRTQTDIVHTRNPEAFFYGFLGAKLGGVRFLVHSEHGRMFDECQIRHSIQRLWSRHTDALFAVTEQLKRDVVSHIGISAQRIMVIYNGVDFSRFASTSREQARAALDIGPDELVVGSVGRLVPVKNYGLLLRAMRGIAIPKAILVLVGDGPERVALASEAIRLGVAERVRFLGHCDDVALPLAAMDVFVLPSLSEGMSNTLLEAMAAGVAVVASQVGGNPEIVRSEIDGLLFPSGDEFDLRDKLHTLLTNPALRTRLGTEGRRRVLRDFSMQAMVSHYEEMYRTLYAGRYRDS